MNYQFLNSQTRNYRKNEILFREGKTCFVVGYILSGEVLIATNSFMGKEIVYKKLRAGDFFGNNLIFSASPLYRGDVKALQDSEVALLTKPEFMKKLSMDAVFLNDYLSYQAQEGRKLNEQIKLLSFDSAEERFFYYLSLHDPLSYQTITSLAAELHLSREVLSRLLHRLEQEKKIQWEKQTIIKLSK